VNRRVITSAADSKYFPLLCSLVRSICDKPEAKSVDLAVLDLGLQPAERAWLVERGVHVAAPLASVHRTTSKQQYAFSSRPLLPECFPGYDVYMWIDADAWVQDWAAVDLYFEGAAGGALAIVPSFDRGYRELLPTLTLKTRLGVEYGLRSWMYDSYRRCYGRSAAQRLAFKPTLNSGVFALRGDAPQWREWQDCYRRSRHSRRMFGFDQIALTYAVYERGLEVEYLPAWCNWVCSRGLPKVDSRREALVEPFLPHCTLGIVHLVLDTKQGEYELGVVGGGTVRRALGYVAWAPRTVAPTLSGR